MKYQNFITPSLKYIVPDTLRIGLVFSSCLLFLVKLKWMLSRLNMKSFSVVIFAVCMMFGCASHLADVNYYSHTLFIEPDKKQFNMKTKAQWRQAPSIDLDQHPVGEQIYHYSGSQLQLRVFVSPELQCADVLRTFFSYSAVEEYLPLSLFAGSPLNYQLELHLLPLSSFEHQQISSLNQPQLKFFHPFHCTEKVTGTQMMDQTLVALYHEMGHLEAIAAWPGGWQHSGKTWWRRHKLDLLVQEIIAGEYEVCAQLLMPMVNGAKLTPSKIWEQGEAAAIKATIEELMPAAGDLTDVGREIGQYHLAMLINQLADTKDQQQYQHILKYCQKVTTPEHINQRLVQFAPYQGLL
jgi:hypothetical protein